MTDARRGAGHPWLLLVWLLWRQLLRLLAICVCGCSSLLLQRLPCLTRPICCAGGSIAGRAIILPLPLGDLQPSLEVPRRSLVVRPCCLLLLLYMLLLLLLWWRPWLTGASWLHRRVPGRRGGGRCCHQHHPWWRLPWVGLHRHLLRQLVVLWLSSCRMERCWWLLVVQRPHDVALLLHGWWRWRPRLLLRHRWLHKLVLRHDVLLPRHGQPWLPALLLRHRGPHRLLPALLLHRHCGVC